MGDKHTECGHPTCKGCSMCLHPLCSGAPLTNEEEERFNEIAMSIDVVDQTDLMGEQETEGHNDNS